MRFAPHLSQAALPHAGKQHRCEVSGKASEYGTGRLSVYIESHLSHLYLLAQILFTSYNSGLITYNMYTVYKVMNSFSGNIHA